MNEQASSERGCWIRAAVSRYEGPLLRYARHITGDVEHARDVVQDTFLKLCREDPLHLDGRLAQWLYTVCRNRALDICRKEKRMKSLSIAEADSQPSREAGQESVAEQRDSYALVQRLMSHFPAHQQEVVRLKFQDGLSYREISNITELSVSNVGYLIHTAIQKVRQELGEAT